MVKKYTAYILLTMNLWSLHASDALTLPNSENTPQEIQQLLTSQFHCSADEFITATWHRFYLIQRLNRTLKIFQQLHKNMVHAPTKTISIDTVLNILNIYSFHHPAIKSSVHLMNKTNSLKPLLNVWNSFKTYKILHDDLFLKEFIQQVFLISHSIVLNTPNTRHSYPADAKYNSPCAPHGLLNLIDKNIDQFLRQKPEYISDNCLPGTACFQTKVDNASVSTPHTLINVDHVMLRFYHIQRMTKLLKKITRFSKHDHPFTFGSVIRKNETIVVDNHLSFTHEQIIICIEKITQLKNISPIVELWGDVKRYTLLDNAQFMKEFCILIFIIEKQLLTDITQSTDVYRKSLSDYLSRIYSVIHSLPLEQIIDALDAAADELYPILDEYEFNSNMSWDEWLSQYMWLIPIIAGKFMYELLLNLNFISPPEPEEPAEEENTPAQSSSVDELIFENTEQ